ncbi:hypothetical protein QCA50_021013 [Cerrena zonata]|uniref:Uncharacterized protein n=1 Tax=Cerrena zonata TaxID=2478898 RepID=A0AAW0FDB9_9APHY
MIIISESLEKKKHSSSNMNISSSTSNSGGRFRAQSLSLNNGNSRSRSRSVSKKQTKELIKQETAQVISKKLLHVLLDLGLQQPIPLKTTNGNINGPSSKTAKVYVANTNDCIYLAPASSASFTYEDVENGGIPQGRSNQDLMDNDDDDDDDDDEYDNVTEDGDLNDEEFKPDVSSLMAEESHNLLKENIQQGYTTVSKALSPDSNFRHIQIHHRLQVCFRISKPDPKDDYKMHHYEVVVDTPLILLSAKCNDDSIQLPKYDEIDLPQPQLDQQNTNNQGSISFRTPNFEHNGVSIKPLVQDEGEQLPSFEEAMSAPSSPITRSISLGDDPLSRIPSIIPKEPAPAYELSLSPSTSPKESHEPVNIDELVHKSSGTNASNARQSRIRSSLLNSFAPTSSNLSSQAPSNTSPSVSLSLAARNSTLSENTDYSPDNALSSIATSSSNGLNSSVPSEDSISSSSKSDESSLCLNNSNTNLPQPNSNHTVDVPRISNEEATRATESEVAPIRSVDAAVSTVMDHEAKKAQELANAKDKVSSQNNIDNSDSVPSAGLNIIQDENISRVHGEKLSKVIKDNNNKFDPTSSVDSLNAVQTQKSNQDDELASLFTQETQETSFDQRLPLLQHQSFDDSLQRSVSSLGAKNYLNSTLVNNDTSRNPRGIMKQLTDNLSVVTEADHHQAQDINHRF